MGIDASELRASFDALPEPCLWLARDGRIAAANAAARRWLSLSSEELSAKALADLVEPPELVPSLLDRWRRGTSFIPGVARFRIGGELVETRCDGALVRVPDGGEDPLVLVRCRPKQDAISSFLTLNRRVSELTREVGRRQRAEVELERQREWFRVTLSSIGDGVIATDAQGRVSFINAAAEHYTGWTAEDAIGRPLTEIFRIVNERSRQPVEAPVERVLREGVVVGLANHTVLIRRDGGELAIADSAAPIRDSRGRVLGVVLVFQDETVRRFNELTREQLLEREREAKERAETANRLKDEFFAVLSHELRTPLNAILGWAELLSDRERTAEDVERGLEVIDRNVRSQVALVDQLLDVARIASGRLELDIAEIDLAKVVRHSYDAVAHAARAKGVALSLEGIDDPFRIAGDAMRLRQAVWNLLSNAIKFTPGGRAVHVTLHRTRSPVELEVRDEGVGIATELLGRLFEPFWQADTTRAGAERGLGLGLSIVLRVAEAHGGTVTVESGGVDKGATFRLRLPLRAVLPAEDLPSAKETPTPGADKASAPRIDGVRVLIVEDDADSREILTVVLTSRGADVDVAENAAEALAILDRRVPDVILSDIAMPGLDGYALARALRARPPERGGTAPAAALTAFVSEADARRALESGFDEHLPKPMRPNDLVSAVGRLAKLGKSRR